MAVRVRIMEKQQDIHQVMQVKQKYQRVLMNLANVVGVGVGFKYVNGQRTDTLSVVANVTKKMPLAELADRDVVPSELEGVLTDVQEVGTFKAF